MKSLLDALIDYLLLAFTLLFFPLLPFEFHECEIITVAAEVAVESEATLGEALLRPQVPVQCLEVKSIQFSRLENMVDYDIDGIGAVAFIPVVPVTNHDTKLRFPLLFVDIVAGTIADVLAIEGFYSQGVPVNVRLV